VALGGSVTLNSTSGGGSVTNVTVSGNSGVLAGVATPTTTPAISIGLGNITPLSDTSVFNGPIGGITPNAGSFTTLNSSGQTLLATGSGNVGIGTSSPATKLEISNGAITAGNSGDVLFGRANSTYPSAGGGYFKLGTNNADASNGGISIFTDSAGTLYERMRIDAYGQTMLGTTTPVATGIGSLTIGATTSSGSTSTGALVVGNGSSGGLGVGGNINAGGTINQWSGLSSSMSSYANFNANNNSSTTIFNGGVLVYSGSGYYYGMDLGYNSSTFRYRTRLFANNTSDVAFSFCGVNPSSQSALTDAVTIRGDSGNVGIGTTSPSTNLQIGSVATNIKNQAYIAGEYNFEGAYLGAFNTNGGASLELVNHTGVSTSESWKITQDGDVYGGGNLVFAYAPSSSSYSALSYTKYLSLNSSGNLYISATTSSSSTTSGALQVAGGVGVQGNVVVGGGSTYYNNNGTGTIHAVCITSTNSNQVTVSALSTGYSLSNLVQAFAGLVVIRDTTVGGTCVIMFDPNQGAVVLSNNIPGIVLTIGGGTSPTYIPQLIQTSGTTGHVFLYMGYGA